jgi:hypothetical protein
MTKTDMLAAGLAHISKWCELNGITVPVVQPMHGQCEFGVCAYYRNGVIRIWTLDCAGIGTAGRQWSYPGYIVDRTPYGVLAHELGHHVDKAHGARGGTLSHEWRRETGHEAPITSYCPDNNEWFAEMFRLFITNPDLLAQLRPRTSRLMLERWPNRAELRGWADVLAAVPRQINAATNRIRSGK